MKREELEEAIKRINRKKYNVYIASKNINYEFILKEWAIVKTDTFITDYMKNKELCVLGSYKNSTLEDINKLIEEETNE